MAVRQFQYRQNYLGAGGWVWGGAYKLERYLYLLHRITGLGIILFGFFHLIETTFFRMQGQTVWEATMALLQKPWFEAGLYLVSIAFVFHALNGLRLILQEFGFALGKPVRPVYPYKDALRKKRIWTILLIAVIAILAIVFLFDFIVSGGG
jgi:succinate dehydrogenase / fumarate reductase cytochrome b subunit